MLPAVHRPAGHFQRMRRLEWLPPLYRAARSAASFRVSQAVLAWAVLAGLFLMHGAASSAVGCQDGEPLMPATATSSVLPPGMATPGAFTGAGHLAVPTLARSAGAVPAEQPPVPARAPFQAMTQERGSHCGGMLCTSRQPRQTLDGTCVTQSAAGTFFTATVVLPPLPAAVPGTARPPGRPGLPLPLFLGVSRT
jgi:hypothetical protein